MSSRLADGYIDIKGLRLTLTQAAWRLSEDLPADVDVSTAAFWAAEAGHRVAHTTVHVHGGVGIDTDHPVHRYFLAAKQTEFAVGGATGQLLRDRPRTGRHTGLIPASGEPAPTPTVTALLTPLVDVDDRGVYSSTDDGRVVRQLARPHSGRRRRSRRRCGPGWTRQRRRTSACCWATRRSSRTVLVAAALTGHRAGRTEPDPPRRGAAARHRARRLPSGARRFGVGTAVGEGIDHIDVESPEWAAELERVPRRAGRRSPTADPDDLFMLIFTSGTSGDPKAVRCTHDKVAFPGVMLTQRFGLGPADICYLSMPLFHSNAVHGRAGRWRWRRGHRSRCGASSPRRSSFPTSGATAPPTPTMSASRCPTSWPPRNIPTTPTIRCGSSTATRAHRAI